MKYFLNLKGEQAGPYQLEEIRGWLNAGHLTTEDLIWFEGSDGWLPIKDVTALKNSVASGHATEFDLIPPFEAYQGEEPYIFISYAHKDSEVVYTEISDLNENGFNIWYDDGIEASNEWPEEIAKAVIGCSLFLVFISPRSTASVNCRNEINLALNEGKPFLAIYLEESTLPPGLRLRMGDLQAILRFKLTKERYQKKVRGSLNQLLGIETNEKILPIKKTEQQKPVSPTEQIQTAEVFDGRKRKKKALIFGSVLLSFFLGLGAIVFREGDEEAPKKRVRVDTKNIDVQQISSTPKTVRTLSKVNFADTEGASVSIRTRDEIRILSKQEAIPRLLNSKPIRKMEGFTRKLSNWKFTSIPSQKFLRYEISVIKPGYVYCFGNLGDQAKIKQVLGQSFKKWESVKIDIRGRMITCLRKKCVAGEVLHLSGFEIQIAAAEIIIGS